MEIGQHFERLLLENGDLRLEQLRKIVRQDAARHADGDAFRPQHEQQGKFAGQRDRLLFPAVVAGDKFRQRIVEQLGARQFGEAAFDVAGRGGGIAGVEVAKIALAFDQVAFVGQHHQGGVNGSVAMRMVFGGVAPHVGDLGEAAVIAFVHGPKDAALHRFEAVGQLGNGAVADDIGGVVQETAVHAFVQREINFPRHERPVRREVNLLGLDVRAIIGRGLSGGCGLGGPAFAWASAVARSFGGTSRRGKRRGRRGLGRLRLRFAFSSHDSKLRIVDREDCLAYGRGLPIKAESAR